MLSARHSDFTFAQAGVWRKLALERAAMKAACSAVSMVRTVRGGIVVGTGVTGPRYRLGAQTPTAPNERRPDTTPVRVQPALYIPRRRNPHAGCAHFG